MFVALYFQAMQAGVYGFLLSQERRPEAGRGRGQRPRPEQVNESPFRLLSAAMRSATGNARGIVARGLPREAGLANREFALEPRLLDLIGGLLLSPAIP